MHENYDLKQEQLNKASLLSSKKFLEDLLEIFSKHVVSTATLKPVFRLMILQFVFYKCGLFLKRTSLIHLLSNFQMRGTGALVISALLDFLTFSLCPPYRYV